MRFSTALLRSTSLCVAAFFLCTQPSLAFDPGAGADSGTTASLPSTNALTNPPAKYHNSVLFPTIVNTDTSANLAPIQFNPTTTPPLVQNNALAFPKVDASTVAKAQPVVAAAPMGTYPAPAMIAPAPLTPTLPVVATVVPSVPQVTAPAPLVVTTSTATPVVAPVSTPLPVVATATVAPVVTPPPAVNPPGAQDGFIAPMPLASSPVTVNPSMPVMTAPTVVNPSAPPGVTMVAAPVMVTPPVTRTIVTDHTPVVVEPQPAMPQAFAAAPTTDTLSPKSKKIIKALPSNIDKPKVEATSRVAVSRVNPKVDAIEAKPGGVESYESSGIKIAVRKPGIDTNAELTTAYDDLSTGDGAGAIDAYKRVLAADPLNEDALFGLASIYHRQGQLDKARPLYGILLKNYPDNRDGLNNFLVLISDEAPQSALTELQELEKRNPDFSPIPAQEGLLLNKMGYIVESRDKMMRAIQLAPDNLTYKYNLAVMFDSQGDYADAGALYNQLIAASQNGGMLPASADSLQKRLNFIALQTTPVVQAN